MDGLSLVLVVVGLGCELESLLRALTLPAPRIVIRSQNPLDCACCRQFAGHGLRARLPLILPMLS